ncbi:hypothetical protein ILYODFUR_014043 [Ilyodon furcidens]|uniref:Uncharacterized protein n=1 Tax=Ilyodon furcidens TaxID=33524 RepID=A0ABV0TY61_9TELE
MTGEQHRHSEDKEDNEGEEQTEQDDKDTQPALVKRSEEEQHQTATDQGQSAPLVTEAWQNSAKAGVRPVPGPTETLSLCQGHMCTKVGLRYRERSFRGPQESYKD